MAFADAVSVAGGATPSGSAEIGTVNPVKVSGKYHVSPIVVADGQVADLQMDQNGNTKVVVQNGASTGTAGSPSASNVVAIQGVPGMVPVVVTPGLQTSGGASYDSFIPPAVPAIHTVKTTGGDLYGIIAFNESAGSVFVKFFDVVTPVLGTTNCSFQFMVPGNTSGAGFVIQLPVPRAMANAIKYAVTANMPANDNTAITATTVVVDVSYN